jgi:hypothetical protein
MGIGVVRILNSLVSQCCRRSEESIKMQLWSVLDVMLASL